MKRSHKIALLAVKYYAPLSALIMMIHVMLLLMGYDYKVAEMSVGLTLLPTVVLYCVDVAFEFCWLHKSMLLYTIGVNICIWIQRLAGFGSILTLMRILVLLVGVVLWVLFVEHINKYNSKCYDGKRT